MLLIVVLFWLPLAWGIKDEELYWGEAGIFAAIWIVLALGFVLLPGLAAWLIGAMVLLGIVLLVKVFGGDVSIH